MRNALILLAALSTAAIFECLSLERSGFAFAQATKDRGEGGRTGVRRLGRERGAARILDAKAPLKKAPPSDDATNRSGSSSERQEASGLESAFDATFELLSHRDAKMRAVAITSLGKLQAKLHARAWGIARLILDEDPQVRIATLDAVRQMGRVEESSEVFSFVVAALFDSDDRVRFRAAVVLRSIDDLALTAEEDLQANKNSANSNSKNDESTRRDAASNVRMESAPAAVGWYAWAMGRTTNAADRGLVYWTARRQSDDIEDAIPIALKCIGGADMELLEAAREHLSGRELRLPIARGLTSDDPLIRRGAARVLFAIVDPWPRKFSEPELLVALQSGLKDRDAGVRLFCFLALYRCPQATLTDSQITSFASDSDPLVRVAAICALTGRRIDGAEVVLHQLAENDPVLRVRVRAAFKLATLLPKNGIPRGLMAADDESPSSDSIPIFSNPTSKALFELARARHFADLTSPTVPQVKIESAVQLTEAILKTVEAECREPLPTSYAGGVVESDDGFGWHLLASLEVLGPAARKAAPWIVKELNRYDTLGADGALPSTPPSNELESMLFALRGIGPVPETIDALRSPRRVTRTIAAMALCEHSDLSPQVAPILIDSLDHECWGYCLFVFTLRADVACLARMGHRAVPDLLAAIRENRNAGTAAWTLSMMGLDSARVVPLLATVVKDKRERPEIRATVARALGSVGTDDAAAAQVLTQLLRDPGEHESIRKAAILGLGASRVPGSIAVVREYSQDESKVIRAAVELALQSQDKEEP